MDVRSLLPPAYRAVLVFVLATALVSGAGCRRRSGEVAEYKDTQPLPEEPRVTQVATLGKYGGRFVMGQTVNPKTFNPLMNNESSSGDITELAFAHLVDFDNISQTNIPGIAKSWEVAPDGVTWTWQLRKGAKFSDGHPITAEDVLFSFAVAYDEVLHPSVQDLLKVDGKPFELSAPDPYTVIMKTAAPMAIFVDCAGSVPIMPKHVLEGAYKKGDFASVYNVSTPPEQIVSSGAWRIVQYVAGEKTVLGRNPHWFGVDQQSRRLPYLDELVLLVVPDQDAADLKFRAGELHGLDNVKPENYRWYTDNQQQGNFTLYDIGPDLNTNMFWFNLNRVQKPTAGKKLGDPFVDPVKYNWFRNPVFRRAVSLAVDRDAMIPSIFFGEGLKNWAIATPANKVWHSPDLLRYDHNVEESKKLLASLGFQDGNRDGVLEDTRGNPITFTMKTNGDNLLRVGMMNFIKDDLAKVGIRVVLTPVDFNTLITNIQSDFQYDAILLGLQSGKPPDPGQMQNVYRSSGFTHFWFINQQKPDTPEEARIDSLMDTIAKVSDLHARKKAYREVETITNEQSWLLWLPIRKQKMPISNRFGNLQPSILRHRILWNSDKGLFVK